MNRDKMHVMFLPRWYPDRYDPMLGLFVRRHAEAAALFNRISVVYVSPSQSATDGWFETVRTEEPNLLTYNIYYRKFKGNKLLQKLFNNLVFFVALMRGMKQLMAEWGRPDLIHVHILTRLALPAFWLKKLWGIPYIITEHWSRYLPGRNEFKGYFRKKLTKKLIAHSDRITVVTSDLYKAMVELGLYHNNYCVLPNVVDLELFKPTERIADRRVRMIHISCFEDKSKNISGLLRVFKSLSKQKYDFECVLVGDGMDHATLVKYAEQLEFPEGQIRFTGILEGEKLAAELSDADFLVLFSRYENMPVVILEALACGIPVVASAVGGIPEIVNENNGMLVDHTSEYAMESALYYMMHSYTKFPKSSLRAVVENKYGRDAVGALLNKWYREAMARNGSKPSV